MPALMDLTSQRFTRWLALKRAEDHIQPNGKRVARWHCVCDCGTERVVDARGLRGGTSTSCGCLHREIVGALAAAMVGADHPSWKGDDVLYEQVHYRMDRSLGKAKYTDCTDCGDGTAAADWSYDGGCADERIWHGHPYCPHPEHYHPRCRHHHRVLDVAARRAIDQDGIWG